MVGRRVNPIDPCAPYADFAHGLRALKDASGKSLRQIGRECYFAVSVLSTAAAGWKLPGKPVTLAFVRACGGCEVEWAARWEAEDEARRSRGRY
jgi:hypothetical protein